MIPKLLLTGLCLFSFFSTALSQSLGEYKSNPKAEKSDQRRTVGTGSRSECSPLFAQNEIILLVPEEKVEHVTVSSSPNLYFYASQPFNQEVDLLFSLIDVRVPEPLLEKVIKVTYSGYHKVSLPVNLLEQEHMYLWHISIPCKNKPQLTQEVLSAAIKYVPPSPELMQKVKLAQSNQKKSSLYAAEGIWYDAIDLATSSSSLWKNLLVNISFPVSVKSRLKEIKLNSNK